MANAEEIAARQPGQAELGCTEDTEPSNAEDDEAEGDPQSPSAGIASPADATGDRRISKRQMKKLARIARSKELKAQRKAADKARKAEAAAERRAAWQAARAQMTPEERAEAMKQAQEKKRERVESNKQRHEKLKRALAEGNQRVVIDLDFEALMSESDQVHLAQQLSYSYSANSATAAPCHLHLLGLSGGLSSLVDRTIAGIDRWYITRSEKKWNEFFEGRLDQVVYLTADSPNELDDLDASKAYVIGGLVDHNKYKGLCFQRAKELGVATARLPIQRHVKLQTSAVLTVNQVVQVLVEFVNRRDWGAVLNDVLPKRKLADVAVSGASAKKPRLEADAGDDKEQASEGADAGSHGDT